MTRKLRSRTGRGLSRAFTGEIFAITVCALYLLTRDVRLLVIGFVLAGFIGFASVVSFWQGQDEFGPTHRRYARRGTYLFFLASLFFVLAFLSFGTFPSASTGPGFPGDNETTSPTTPHRFKDLLPPLFLLAVALVLETLSGAYYLWELIGASRRRLLIVYASLGALVGVALFGRGYVAVSELRRNLGENVRSIALADFHFQEFLADVLPVFTIGFAVTRVVAAFLIRLAREKVGDAEQDASSELAQTP